MCGQLFEAQYPPCYQHAVIHQPQRRRLTAKLRRRQQRIRKDWRTVEFLHVEDDEFVATATSRVLSKVFPNAAITVVGSGEEAVEASRDIRFYATLAGEWDGQTTVEMLSKYPNAQQATGVRNGGPQLFRNV